MFKGFLALGAMFRVRIDATEEGAVENLIIS
jgi:hypothetical protein